MSTRFVTDPDQMRGMGGPLYRARSDGRGRGPQDVRVRAEHFRRGLQW